eukprot:ANDGO_00081.mRNA.1 hypothetical protein
MTSNDDSQQVRVRTEIVFVIGIIYGFCCGVVLGLFYRRRKIDPIKARSPILLLIANGASLILVTYAAVRQKYLYSFACPDVFWLLFTLFPATVFPYFLRCVRLYFQYNGQMQKTQSSIAHKFASERFNVYVMIIALAFVSVPLAIVQGVRYDQLSPDHQDACQDFVGDSFYVIAGALLIFMFLFIAAIYVLRNVRDEYSINSELKLVCFFTVMCLVPFFVMSLTIGSWPASPYPPLFFALLSFLCMIISVLWPLVQSYRSKSASSGGFMSGTGAAATAAIVGAGAMGRPRRGTSSKGPQSATGTSRLADEDPRSPLNPDAVLNFSQFIQIDDDHRKTFETYLARTFQLPLLNFWLEVREFNQNFSFWSNTDQRSHVDQIVETYIQDDSRWELSQIDNDARKKVMRKLRFMDAGHSSSEASTYSSLSSYGTSPYEDGALSASQNSSHVFAHLFDELEKLVYQKLEGEIWETFLSSNTLQKWKREQSARDRQRRL